MKNSPILFSAPMVRAILGGSKTMTRRVLKLKGYKAFSEFQPSGTNGYDWTFRREDKAWCDFTNAELLTLLPYQVGATLWVREAWNVFAFSRDGDNVRPFSSIPTTDPREDESPFHSEVDYAATSQYGGPWRPSIHMPRWASRITLRVTAVKVERLQDISEAEAWSEGIEHWMQDDKNLPTFPDGTPAKFLNARQAFKSLWESINGPGSWDANPWVAAYSFEVVH